MGESSDLIDHSWVKTEKVMGNDGENQGLDNAFIEETNWKKAFWV